jgi:small subunit ribosomal protein S7
MSRRGGIKIRKTNPDPVFKNRLVTKLVNRSMKDGKKSVIQKEVYKAFELIKTKLGEDPMKIFSKALENIKPSMEVRPRRIGGAAYQVPTSVRASRKESLAIRWLLASARARGAELRTFSEKLAAEIIDASNGEGSAVKKRTDMERMAEANRAFAHFRW